MTVFMDPGNVPAVPGNAHLLLEKFTTRTEWNAEAYDACLRYIKACMEEWNEEESPLSLTEYQGEVVGFFAGYEAARRK